MVQRPLLWLLFSTVPCQLGYALENATPVPLREGPLASNPMFATSTNKSVEGELALARAEGRKVGGVGSERSSKQERTLAIGLSWPLGGEVAFSARLRHDSEEFKANNANAEASMSHQQDSSDFSLGPTVWFGALGLGGEVGAAFLGEETTETTTINGTTSRRVNAATAPKLLAYAALRLGQSRIASQVETYDATTAEVRTTSGSLGDSASEVSLKPADRFSVHGKTSLLPDLDLSLSSTYSTDQRDSSEKVVQTARWSLTLGGVYRTPKAWQLLASYRYSEPGYDAGHPPSLLADNLGGARLGVGLVIAFGSLVWRCDMGYASSGKVRGEDQSSPANALATTSATFEQKTWDAAMAIAQEF